MKKFNFLNGDAGYERKTKYNVCRKTVVKEAQSVHPISLPGSNPLGCFTSMHRAYSIVHYAYCIEVMGNLIRIEA